MNITEVSGRDAGIDSFVESHAAGNICHTTAWSCMLQEHRGYSTHYLAAYEGQSLRGVLPLTHVKSALFGNRLVSQAHSNYGGVLADDAQATEALYQHAVQLAGSLGCQAVDFRSTTPLPHDLPMRQGKISMHLPLTADPEDLWKGFDPKVRNQVRKAQKSELVADQGGLELVDEFYELYTIRMRDLGTPPYHRDLYKGILTAFPNNSRIFVVRQGTLTLGAGMVTAWNGFVEIPSAATRVEFNNLCPNNLLYWSIMEHYCRQGMKTFDFGRCTVESNTYRFKKQWDSQAVDLYYQSWVKDGARAGDADHDDAGNQWKIRLWKRLPLWVTRKLGAKISRGLA